MEAGAMADPTTDDTAEKRLAELRALMAEELGIKEPTFSDAAEGDKLVSANGTFALDLYRFQATATSDNMLISPLNISMGLAMTYLGARNNTKRQMANVTHFGDVSEACLHQLFNDVKRALNKPDQPFQLCTANRLFGDKTHPFLDEYLLSTEKYYEARLDAVNFRADPSGVTSTVNEWVAENTNQKITEILSPGVINSLTRLILINAIYFKGTWKEKFNPKKTKRHHFHVSAKEKVRVMFMHIPKAPINYGTDGDLLCKVVELQYVGDRLSMFILLPDKSTTLSKVESTLTTEHLINVDKKFRMGRREVNVWLPRFKLNEKLGLPDVLATMGMTDLFNAQNADLSGIDGSRNLFVSDMVHQAVIDVNEEGTEAAAYTRTVIAYKSKRRPDPMKFRANRPFLFFIRDNDTKSILFLGRLTKPVSQS